MKHHLKEIMTFRKVKINPMQIIGSGLCMLIILFTGYFLDNLLIASYGSLGIFVFLYYQNLPLKNLLTRFSAVSAFIFLSYIVSSLSTHVSWTAPLVVATIGFLGRIFFRLYEITKPGVFFGVMVSAMGVSSKIPLAKLPMLSLFFLLGIALAFLIAIIVHYTEKTPPPVMPKRSLSQRLADDPAVILDGLFYASTLFLAMYLSQSLQLTNPYWFVVSCAAILQGDNLRAMMHRNIQRIFGTTIGLGLSALLLTLPLSTVQTLLVITLLYIIVEYTVRSNYAMANFFITPMALMLSSLMKQQYVTSLLQDRFIGIVLGSLLGVLAAWVMTTGLTFYNKAFQLHETLDKETD
ncbi:FUSC family protein [Enterococcus saccharolyticus]|uniref:FUSC family protein n=1 Tax=Enterococcus saccharolyticus TaxID=41997 RepID=UPI001E3F449D|nr:FUSC family protein [Enterococcus saccharolyticus]MCD5003448.1 FUSC family protein [Enterococcus saccharolyticus]